MSSDNANDSVTSLIVTPDAANAANKSARPKKAGMQSRRKSRELAVKAVYRSMLNASDMKQLLRDMTDDPDYNKADVEYFRALLQTVSDNMPALDEKLTQFVDRTLAELSPIEHAILRVSGAELVFDMSIPYRVVINEGVELAKLYGGTDGHKYINGVLDKLAADVRAIEIAAR